MKRTLLAMCLILLTAGAGAAQTAKISAGTLDSSGGTGSGGNLKYRLSLGQPLGAGDSRSASQIVRLGYQQLVSQAAMAAPKLYFPLFVTGQPAPYFESYVTGIALVNLNSARARVTYTAYDPNGNLYAGAGITNPATRELPGHSQLPIFEFELFGFARNSPRSGWIEVASDQPVVGFFLLFDARFDSVVDGVDVTSSSAPDLVFTHAEINAAAGVETFYSLCNPGSEAASAVISVRSAANADLGTRTISLRAKGQASLRLSDLLNILPPGGLRGGYVTVSADRPVAGLQLFGNTRRLSALRAQSLSPATQLVFPHFAVRGGFATDLSVTNLANTAANMVLRAYGNDGKQIGADVSRSLASRQQLLAPVDTLFGIAGSETVVGYIQASSDTAGLIGFTNFTYGDVASAAVPVDSAPRTSMIFSQVANDVDAGGGRKYLTGVAVANTSKTQTATYTVTVRDGAGNSIASNNFTLPPGAKVSKVLSFPDPVGAFFTTPIRIGSGYITVTSNIGLFGFELFFSDTLDLIAAVPGQL